MPSPFPGMDPFLEDPVVFPDLHDSMIVYLREALQTRLPEPYFAACRSLVWVEPSERPIEPNGTVLRPAEDASSRAAGVALAPASPRSQPVIVHVPHDEHRHTYGEIRLRREEGERVVTVLEVLSPTNKTPGEHGRDLYLRKQQEVLNSETHLVEIDLLRGGRHATAVPLARALEATGPLDYHACVHRFDKFEDYSVYPFRLPDRLPEIAIPLLPGDPDVLLDLQAVFERCYNAGPYRRQVRYGRRTPVPALRPDQTEWVNQVLRANGLLPPV
jgi:hypothetical protein